MMIRSAKLRELNDNYTEKKNTICLLYGRQGCEKEGLLRQYVQDKKYFYYRARQASAQEQYCQLKAQVEAQYETHLIKGTYAEAFNRIKSGDASKLVVVIDEFQYIVKKNGEFIDALAKLREKRLYPGPVQIILCSSDVAWVEQQMETCLGELSPRISLRMKLSDLTFLDLVRAYPKLSVEEVVAVYGVIGGVSSYVSRWNPNVGFKNNVCRNILSPYGYLFSEAENYIASQLRELSVYDTILAAIAAGNRKLNELFHITGFSRAKISVYLKNLMEFDVIEKVDSFETGGQKNTQKGLYQICDTYVNFWFKFIYPHQSELHMMPASDFYDRFIAPELQEYLNRYFRQVCVEYVQLLNQVGQLPLKLTKFGTWIGKQGTIDLVAQDAVRTSLVGICNWSKPMLGIDEVRKLEATLKKARLKPAQIYLFTAHDFSDELKALQAKDDRYVLVDMKQL